MATPGLGPRGFVPSGPDAGHGGYLGPAPTVGPVAPPGLPSVIKTSPLGLNLKI